MPKKSTKSRSGRKTLRHKHKVIKKVKEHHRKKAKEQKKLAKTGRKPREPKDPGIPAEWPFKAELIKELEFARHKLLAKEQVKKDAKKLARVSISMQPAVRIPNCQPRKVVCHSQWDLST